MQAQTPFDPAQYLSSPLQKGAYKLFAKPIDSLLSISKLEGQIAEAREVSGATGRPFIECFHDRMGVRLKIDPSDLAKIPTEGPVVVLSNHPFGLLDASILCRLLPEHRADTKFLANYLLAKLPEAEPHTIAVDPFDGERSASQNLKPMREAIQWLRDGHLLGTFPAGRWRI